MRKHGIAIGLLAVVAVLGVTVLSSCSEAAIERNLAACELQSDSVLWLCMQARGYEFVSDSCRGKEHLPGLPYESYNCYEPDTWMLRIPSQIARWAKSLFR